MRMFHRLMRIAPALGLLLLLAVSGDARTRKGDKFLAEGRKAESRKEWDRALELYEKALKEDPSDVGYDVSAKRARFQSASLHLKEAQRIRATGDLEAALAEVTK